MATYAHFTDSNWLSVGSKYDTKSITHSRYWASRYNDTQSLPLADDFINGINPREPFLQPLKKILDKQLVGFTRTKLELVKELIFEEIRVLEFSEKPSRRNCIFLLDEINADIEINRFGSCFNGKSKIILETLDDHFKNHVGDANLLNCNNETITNIVNAARRYWKSETTENPMLEILGFGALKRIR